MKKNIILTIILAVGLLACSDDEEPTPPPQIIEPGEAYLLLNDKLLEFDVIASSWTCNPNNLAISFNRSSRNFAKGTSFSVGNIPAKEGRYALQRRNTDIYNDDDDDCKLDTPFGSALAYGGETLVAFYEILKEKGTNELVITHYDSAAQRLEGRLQIALAVEEKLFPIGELEHPDTLRITQGIFTTNISPLEE